MRATSATVLLAVALTGCASKSDKPVLAVPAPASRVVPAGSVSYGTILIERPVLLAAESDAPATASAAGGDVRSAILSAIGGGGSSEAAANGDDAEMPDRNGTEFIIRVDNGRTISVVESGGLSLRPGERVMIIQGAETRLVPVAQS